MPGIIRAQSTSKPVRIGLLSDMGGPYRDVGGPGNRLAVELAVADFGGSVLDRPIEVLQGDDQNKPDVSSSLAREWIDSQGVDVARRRRCFVGRVSRSSRSAARRSASI